MTWAGLLHNGANGLPTALGLARDADDAVDVKGGLSVEGDRLVRRWCIPRQAGQPSIARGNQQMKIYLANPRGFCAGVDRAIDIVGLSPEKYGAPIYVRHEIVQPAGMW